MLKRKIEKYFDEEVSDLADALRCIDEVFSLLNTGEIRVSEKIAKKWKVNTWIKKAILLGFKLREASEQDLDSFDKFGLLKYNYANPRYRKVPFAIIRNGVYIGDNAVIMPSCINIGAYIGNDSMVDMNATIGSCAQIGERCHIAASSCIGGVLEPLIENPVIVEDNCFIGANSALLEGVIVEEGSVIAAGVSISASTRIIDRSTGNVSYGIVPLGSVVVSGSYPSNGINIACAVVVKKVDAKTMAKSSFNEILRGI
ncbi:MAG: 2,3,4,5-tetrahydropyridine-2,6-dicarboxylate N-succinyltransferase [Holosporales bacterium]|jgi:2,3,4,5-tetrahydropyridine-2-carboxylate N-succinyltransferase|nr:2,3,4,5-tetrahydropyridine-2,6-dicarboxylate N-succinyltransferase [Holosporales bacterium]